MKQTFLIAFLTSTILISAQKEISPSLVLKIESKNGNKGIAVAYNKKKNIYYTAFLGNSIFSLEVHDNKGNSIYQQPIGTDIRGMWYNEKTNQLEGILYANRGVFSYTLTEEGFPDRITINGNFSYGKSDQTQGTFYNGNVYFFENNKLSKYKLNNSNEQQINIDALLSKVKINEINTNGLMLTGLKKEEIAILDYKNKIVYVINEKKGNIVKEFKVKTINSDMLPNMFNVSAANGLMFIYDKNTRTWNGYDLR